MPPKRAQAGEWEVLVPHTWEDDQTGESIKFKAGDDYTGRDFDYVDPNYGPIVRKRTRLAADSPEEN